jgi:hypothetical protein
MCYRLLPLDRIATQLGKAAMPVKRKGSERIVLLPIEINGWLAVPTQAARASILVALVRLAPTYCLSVAVSEKGAQRERQKISCFCNLTLVSGD